jgi:hypothetical protein
VSDQVSQKYVAQLEEYVTNVKQAIIDCFKPNPIPCDGVLLVPTDRYNKLVDAVNAKLSRPDETINFPCLMLVGNTIVDGNPYGKHPVTIVKLENDRYYAENGHSWKYAKPVKPVESSALEQAGIDPAAWIYDWFDESGNEIKDWTTTRKAELKSMVANCGAHNIRALDIRKPFESCKIHGPGQPNAWACPECLRELREENKILKTGIKAVRDLMDSSQGVAGLHLNGDVAPWEEISEGGRFEEHLLAFNEAEKLLGDRK